MQAIANEVEAVIQRWPKSIQPPVLRLRELIFATAKRQRNIQVIETLKWNEPAYSAKKGTTIRLGWSAKTPEVYRLHFICTSKLGETYKELYADTLTIEGMRALAFHQLEKLPVEEVSHCISLALRYHEIKSLPNLGC